MRIASFTVCFVMHAAIALGLLALFQMPGRGEEKTPAPPASGTSKLVRVGLDGKLSYQPYTERGDIIPDFSHCGYGGGGVKLPDAPVKSTVAPEPGAADDTQRIQAAIDQVAKLPPDRDGLRGAVLLKRGRYRIDGALQIAASGVVVRGEGQGEDGTVLIGTGTSRRVLLNLRGEAGAAEVKLIGICFLDAPRFISFPFC